MSKLNQLVPFALGTFLVASIATHVIAQQPNAAGGAPPATTAQPGADATQATPPATDPVIQAIVKKGIEHIKAKEFPQAVNAFNTAAKRYPKDAQIRHLYGFALFQNKQLGPAWLQFRIAVRLNMAYQPAVRDFLLMWKVFDQQGVMNIGRSSEELAKYLGEPDRKFAQDPTEVWEYGFMRLQFNQGRLYAIVDPRGLDVNNSRPADAMQIDFDDKTRWRLGYRAINRLQSVTEYVPQGEAVQKWNEMYTVQRLYQMRGKKTPQQMMAEIETNLKKAIPTVEFKPLVSEEGNVVFHWRDKGDTSTKPPRPPQHEIVRLIAGEKDIHRLAYARRVAQIPTAEAQSWITLLRQAQLKKTPDPVAAPK